MLIFSSFLMSLVAATAVSISEPADGGVYDGEWLTVRAIVENENVIPDSVHYSLNGGASLSISRLNTDWYTYMANDLHTGFSESPAPSDNTILWAAQVTGDYHEFPSPVVVNGIVYYPQDSTGDSLFALDAATGEILWKYHTGYTDDAVTVKDGYLYTASDSLFCLDAETGERIWSHYNADNQGGTPVVADGLVYGATAVYSSSQSWLYCMDALTGADEWAVSFPGYTASCMTHWNGMLFVATFNGPLYALDASTGAILWQNTDCTLGYWDSSPVVVDGLIYICDFDSKVRAVDPADGSTVWSVDITPGTYISATLAYHNSRLYFGDQVDSFRCIDVDSGSSIWTSPGAEHGSTGLADGKVFFGQGSNYYDETANFYCLDWNTGELIWNYETSSGPYGFVSSPSITDGVVYMAGTDWNLYAFGTGLKFTYLDDLFAAVGSNQLIVTSFNGGLAAAADTVNFTVTDSGFNPWANSAFKLVASPNPFTSTASITFQLSGPAHTELKVYDLAGRSVVSLVDSYLSAGNHSLEWNGTDQTGERVSAGLYLCRIESGDMVETMGLCLLR